MRIESMVGIIIFIIFVAFVMYVSQPIPTPNIFYYKCVGDKCIQTQNTGKDVFFTEQECKARCPNKGGYYCENNKTCVHTKNEGEEWDFINEEICKENCPKVEKRYSCDYRHKCNEDKNGEYKSLEICKIGCGIPLKN